jgi:hypothetical protein
MKHFYCDFRVQHLCLHTHWHISFLLVAKKWNCVCQCYMLSRFTPSYHVEQHFVSWRPHLYCEVKPVPKAVILTLTFGVTIFSAELTSRWRDRGLRTGQAWNLLSRTCFCLGLRWLTKCSGPSEADRCYDKVFPAFMATRFIVAFTRGRNSCLEQE